MKRYKYDVFMVLLALRGLVGVSWILIIYLSWPRLDQSPLYLYWGQHTIYVPGIEVFAGCLGLCTFPSTSRSWLMLVCFLACGCGALTGGLLCISDFGIFSSQVLYPPPGSE